MSGTRTLTICTPGWYTVIMARIPLFGRRGLGKFATVDDEDVGLVAGIRWHVNDMGYAVNRTNGTTVRMHRLINKTPDGLFTDHKNGKTLDNRKSNLRTVTMKENAQNNHSARGYTWDASKNKWMVRYRRQFYGRYATEQEAQIAYRLACSGVPYQKSRRKLWYLPTHISKQQGKYTVRPQVNGVRYWLGAYATLDEAKEALNKWQGRG